MKTKLILSTETKDFEHWANLEFVPEMHEWFNIQDILEAEELEDIQQSAKCWSGNKGTIESVEYRHNDNEYYAEVFIWCED